MLRRPRPMRATGKVRPALADLLTDFFLLPPRPPLTILLVLLLMARACRPTGRVGWQTLWQLRATRPPPAVPAARAHGFNDDAASTCAYAYAYACGVGARRALAR
eukprot:scaffold21095_cov66-Phaeocystis_antarctica.AAC.1